MLTEVKRHLSFFICCIRYNLAREMENRAAFIMQAVGMMANNGIMILQWVVLFSIRETIGGYGFRDMALLWAISSSAFGVAHALFVNVISIPALVTGGKLDAYLVQPKNALVNVACSRMSVSAIGDFFYGILLTVIVRVSPASFLIFVAFAFTGGVTMAAFYTISGCLSFWLGNSEDLTGSLNNMLVTFGTYPEGLFGGMGKWVLYTFIPVGFVSYIPVKVLREFDIALAAGSILFACLLAVAAFVLFHRGLRKYNSGNLMSARI